MHDLELINAISKAVTSSRDREVAELDRFYSQTHEIIHKKETVELPSRSISFPMNMQKALTAALKRAGVPYVNTVIRKIEGKMPVFGYIYVDWRRTHADTSTVYDEETFSDNKSRLPVIIGAGVWGVVTVTGILLPGSGTLASVITGAAAGVTSGVVTKLVMPQERGNSAGQARESTETFDAGNAIAAAKKHNIAIIDAWCKKLEEVSVKCVHEMQSEA